MASGSGHKHAVGMVDSLYVDFVAVAQLDSFKCDIVHCLAWRAQSLACVCSGLEAEFGKAICFPKTGNSWGAAVVNFSQDANYAGLVGRPVAVANATPATDCHNGWWEAFESSVMSHMPQWKVLPSSDKITDLSFLCCSVYRGRDTVTNKCVCVFALWNASGAEAFRTSFMGLPLHVVRTKRGVGILTESLDHELILWDVNGKTVAWTQRLVEPIQMVACPDDALALCITRSTIACFSMETGEQLFKDDALLTTKRHFDSEPWADYKESKVFAIAHSDKFLFVVHSQEGIYWDPPDFQYDDDDDDEGTESWVSQLWISAIDLQTGEEKWTTSECSEIHCEIHLEYHANTGSLFVGSDSSNQFYVLDSDTGHVMQRELLNQNAGVAKMKAVDNLLVSVIDETTWIGASDEDRREYKVLVRGITPLGLIPLFTATQRTVGVDADQESICDASLVHSRFLCWITKSGRLIVTDMLTGKRVHDASLGYSGNWTLLFDASWFEADQGPALAQYPDVSMTDEVFRQTAQAWADSCGAVCEEWFAITLKQMRMSTHPHETLKLRCALLQQHIPTQFYERVTVLVFEKLNLL